MFHIEFFGIAYYTPDYWIGFGGGTTPTGGEEDYYIIWGRRRGRR